MGVRREPSLCASTVCSTPSILVLMGARAAPPQAIGFVRESAAPEHQLRAVVGKSGLMRFWDCCGAESEAAPGCCTGPHVAFGEEL